MNRPHLLSRFSLRGWASFFIIFTLISCRSLTATSDLSIIQQNTPTALLAMQRVGITDQPEASSAINRLIELQKTLSVSAADLSDPERVAETLLNRFSLFELRIGYLQAERDYRTIYNAVQPRFDELSLSERRALAAIHSAVLSTRESIDDRVPQSWVVYLPVFFRIALALAF